MFAFIKQLNNAKISIGLLLLFHLVGAIGLSIPSTQPLFLKLTPFQLIWTAVLFFWNADKNWSLWWSFLSIAILGFFIEVIGVATQAIFGHYGYGNVLGWSWMNVPLLIGLNWFILSVSCYGILKLTSIHWLVQSIIAALLMVVIDFFIEPVAIKYDFWHWENQLVPAQNFIAWGIVALLMQCLLHYFKPKANNLFLLSCYLIQLFFFILLGIK